MVLLAKGLESDSWHIVQGKTARQTYLALEHLYKPSAEVLEARARKEWQRFLQGPCGIGDSCKYHENPRRFEAFEDWRIE